MSKRRFRYSVRGKAPADQTHAGFTLLEILVATSVLALILLLMLQLVNSTILYTRAVTQQMDASQSARLALDVIAMDIRHSVIDGSATITVGDSGTTDALGMLTTRRGPRDSTPRFLAVRYALINQELHRFYGVVGYDVADLLSTIPSATSQTVLARGVLAMSVQAILNDGSLVEAHTIDGSWTTNSYWSKPVAANQLALIPCQHRKPETDGPSCVKGLEITLVSIDKINLDLLEALNLLSSTSAAFTMVNPNQPAAQLWTETVNQRTDIPATARQAIRIVNKSIPLP